MIRSATYLSQKFWLGKYPQIFGKNFQEEFPIQKLMDHLTGSTSAQILFLGRIIKLLFLVKNQFFERSEVKPQVGEAETNVGVSQSDAGHIFDDVDNGDTGDVISENTNGKSATKTGFNFFQENSL